jgi:hypothetical protein
MPHSPALFSLCRLCVDGDCSFACEKGLRPWLTLPTGASNQVPRWLMSRTADQLKSLARPSTTGGSSGSGGPAVAPSEERTEQQNEEEPLLEGDLPPDLCLGHRPKIGRCEACQEAKLFLRQCRRALGESRAARQTLRRCLEA